MIIPTVSLHNQIIPKMLRMLIAKLKSSDAAISITLNIISPPLVHLHCKKIT